MESSPRRFFHEESAATAFWDAPAARCWGWGGRARETLSEAAHFLGGALLSHGFRLFQNGGLPLLERRRGPLVEELLLRGGVYDGHDGTLRVRVRVHLSHQGVRPVRERYWRPASRPPLVVAAGDLGELDLPPGWAIWNVGGGMDALEDLAEWVQRLAAPWYAAFEDPREMRDRLYGPGIALIDHQAAIELLLAEFGPAEASRYLGQFVVKNSRLAPQFWRELHDLGHRVGPDFDAADAPHRLATIAHFYRLI